MEVKVHLLSQARPITYLNTENTYTKDGLFCVYFDGKVHKFPLVNIFRVEESYV